MEKSEKDTSPVKEDRHVETIEENGIGPLDNNFPLWVALREAAPGSYKHTQSLINMVENVSSSIGLNSDILRIATRFHDIGKMWAPNLFTENQGKDNVHDNLDPWVSYHLLTKHVSDTAAIMLAYNFSPDIINIAIQHHGTTVLRAMYEKAKKIDENVDENKYRYNTQKPTTIESLILMMCDQVEATSRSLYIDQAKDVDPDVFINNIFNKLVMDGQFDEVELKIGLISKIQKALSEDVSGNYQKRITYEEDDELVQKK